ncbi:MAG: hypothetical protein B7Z55_11930, partial [Planctomycetales bacterium 12-60-4]
MGLCPFRRHGDGQQASGPSPGRSLRRRCSPAHSERSTTQQGDDRLSFHAVLAIAPQPARPFCSHRPFQRRGPVFQSNRR